MLKPFDNQMLLNRIKHIRRSQGEKRCVRLDGQTEEILYRVAEIWKQM